MITGAGGQLAQELVRRAPGDAEIVALDRRGLDVTSYDRVQETLRAYGPDLVINTAAYTAVDAAEHDAATAYAVNAEAAGHLAAAAAGSRARLIHISTDFVFDGRQGHPYRPEDPPNPLSVYGASKLAGERQVLEHSEGAALVVRTAWVYSGHGRNFARTMLRLMAERDALSVVTDQVSTPTWAGSLAEGLWQLARLPAVRGVHHLTDAGVASWYDFAVAIREEALRLGLLDRRIPIEPVSSEQFQTAATRPAYSVLDKAPTWALIPAWPLRPWTVALRSMLAALVAEAVVCGGGQG